jgi:hypothetical protein
MSTPRQVSANRGNARGSTGPRTKAGKARAARNARRHGLSVAVFADAVLSSEVEVLARQMVADAPPAAAMAMARRVAEAQVDLARIRRVRRHLTEVLLRAELDPEGQEDRGGQDDRDHALDRGGRDRLLRALRALDRYERRALARRKTAAKAFDPSFMATVGAPVGHRSLRRRP